LQKMIGGNRNRNNSTNACAHKTWQIHQNGVISSGRH
jgi:hypothetical protein